VRHLERRGLHVLHVSATAVICKRFTTVKRVVWQCCVRLSSVVCDVIYLATRCVLDQKLLLTAYRKSHIRNRLIPKWMTLTFL